MSNFIFNETERTIAIRYIKSRRVEGFISVSAWFSLVGIVLGVATLIVVMSVMNGFRTELVNRILGINGHLIVYKKNGLSIENYHKIVNEISDTQNVIAVTPYLEGQALAKTKNSVSGIIIRGTKWSDLPAKKLLWKSLDDATIENFKTKQNVILGYRLAQRLNLRVGDYISLISPNVMETAIGVLPIKQNFMVGGFFDIGMYEYDNTDERAGAKLARADLIGLPYQILIGPKGIKEELYDLKCRKSGEISKLSYNELLNFVQTNT